MWVCNNHLIFVHFSCDFLLQFCCAHECSEIERFTEKYNNKDEKIVFDILASMQRARSFIFIAIIFCNKPGREKKDGEWIWNSQLDAVWTGVKKMYGIALQCGTSRVSLFIVVSELDCARITV